MTHDREAKGGLRKLGGRIWMGESVPNSALNRRIDA